MTRTRPTVVAALSLLLIASYAAVLPSAQAATLNRPPDAQAGPSPHVVDGGSNDADGSDDGTVAITLDGTRSTDPDNELNNEITCKDLLTTFNDEELTYRWYRGHGNISDKDPIAYGETPTLDLKYGLHNFTVEVEDKCEQTDTDIVTAFALNASATTDVYWDFNNGTPTALTDAESLWRVTNECDIEADGQYLIFNRPDVCDYDTTSQVQGNATLDYDMGSWFVAGIQFDTLWDTRDDYVSDLQDHMTVQASLDHGRTWTDANLTFNISQGDYESNSSWVSASGIFDLKRSQYKSGNISFRFMFDSGSSVDSGNLGWAVDNVTLVGLRDSMFTSSWNGTEFEVSGDTIKRAGLNDTDGDGFADMGAVNITPGSLDEMTLENLTNQDIQNATERANLTDSEIKSSINETLDWNSSYDDDRALAFDLIDDNYYIEAAEELLNTPAQINYYCGLEGEVPSLRAWVVGIPSPLDCDRDPGFDIQLNTTARTPGVCIDAINTIRYYPTMEGLQSDRFPEILWGVGFAGADREVGGFINGDRADNYVESYVRLRHLCDQYQETGLISLYSMKHPLNSGENMGLFTGAPKKGNTVEVVLDSQTDDEYLMFEPQPNGIHFTDISRVGWRKVLFSLNTGDRGHVEGFFCRQADDDPACENMPQVGSITFTSDKVDKGDNGTAHEIYFASDDVDAMRVAKWHWTVYKNNTLDTDTPETTLDFVGMPKETYMRLDDGKDINDAGIEADEYGIASIDITDKGAAGRFGSFNLDSTKDIKNTKFDVEFRGTDINRFRFAVGPDPDVQDYNFTELTANLPDDIDNAEATWEGKKDGWAHLNDASQFVRHVPSTTSGSEYHWEGNAGPHGDSGTASDGQVASEEYSYIRVDEYNQYFLDTIKTDAGDYYSGLEFDEIADTGDYPCAFAIGEPYEMCH